MKKAFIETTVNCNISCTMCMKNTTISTSPSNSLLKTDMDYNLFKKILKEISKIEFLCLSGIGEPLLHPRIIDFIELARESLNNKTTIGFNSNGLLIDNRTADRLVHSGLDKIAISIDSTDLDLYAKIRRNSDLDIVLAGMDSIIKKISKTPGTRLIPGVQIVLMKDNVSFLPEMIHYFGERGVRFLIVSHMLPYDMNLESNVVYDANSEGAVAVFNKYRNEIEEKNITYNFYHEIMKKFLITKDERDAIGVIMQIMEEASFVGEYVNIRNILKREESSINEIGEIFDKTAWIADKYNMQIELPAIIPRADRRCDFIEEESIFIDTEGYIYPCYMLWHSYTSFIHGRKKFVKKMRMGDLNKQSIREIWEQRKFRKFREDVRSYNVPYCTDCNLSSCCDYVMAEDFQYDCSGNTIPCGDCLWCKGIFKCLSS